MIRSVNNNSPNIMTIYLILAFFHLQVIFLIPQGNSGLYASDQSGCSERLDQAEEFYYDGDFDKTIEIVNQCLQEQSISNNDRTRAHTLLARTYLAKENIQTAKENVRIILKLEPEYQPTIEQETPKFVNLVTEVRKEQEQLAATEAASGISSWLLIGAGSVAAVAIIAIVASGSGDEKGTQNTSLPKPPDFPE